MDNILPLVVNAVGEFRTTGLRQPTDVTTGLVGPRKKGDAA